jgi:hypothetical protein
MTRYLIIIVTMGLTASCAGVRSRCQQPSASVDSWPVIRMANWPELSFRLPPTFHNEYPKGPWSGPGSTDFAIQVAGPTDDPFFTKLPSRKNRPEYRICQEQIAGRKATIVSYNLREDVGDLAFVGPLQFYARIELPHGAKVLIYGQSEDRKIHNEMLAAIRTVRFADSLRVRPNTR